MASLQFAPWSSEIELAFYSTLASIKIDHDRLDESARFALGLYEIRPQDAPHRSCRLQIHGNALNIDEPPPGYIPADGTFLNVNTFQAFRSLDKAAIQDQAARKIWDAIKDGSILERPSLLASFSAVCFADLKKYKFTYHFCFPAIHSDPPWRLLSETGAPLPRLTSAERTELSSKVQEWRQAVKSYQHGFFLAKRVLGASVSESGDGIPQWSVGSLSEFEKGFLSSSSPADQYICFADPSTHPGTPGWPLRNLLVLIKERWKMSNVQILCYRENPSRQDPVSSLILSLQSAPQDSTASATLGVSVPSSEVSTATTINAMPKASGWERTEAGKLNNRTVDLAAYMDPRRLADQAVDLNLKLIKWRIAPDIDLDIIKETKCLLLGAGTLGSYVSRNLMGWGVRKITFIDNGNVSFSNPVRQPLFNFTDCLDGGVKKAPRAAEALTQIYPGVDATGHAISVPMAGHPILDEERTARDFELLHRLIDEHDVVFLLLDTRESRWLPTVMAKTAGKIVMNAALGFDTFVVMRHGLAASTTTAGGDIPAATAAAVGGEHEYEAGCYFCNDVVAPADSLKAATLDQQCTVTRPGIAPIASAMLVELMVSILQHPLRARAPVTPNPLPSSYPSSSSGGAAGTLGTAAAAATPAAATPASAPPFRHPLGTLPHQLRGSLSTFSTASVSGSPFPACSACSPPVLAAYAAGPWAFVQRALAEPGWIEEVSGLAEVQRLAQLVEDQGGLEAWVEEDEDEDGAELI